MAAILQIVSRAGFFIRALAFAIDAIVIFVAYAILFALVGGLDMWPGPQRDRLSGLTFSLVLLIYTFTEVIFAATPGKLLMRLRIRTRFGPPGDWSLLFLRWSTKQSPYILMLLDSLLPNPLFKLPMGLLNVVLLCGTLAALNDDHLAWHDQWSGSSVWRVRRLISDPQFSRTSPSDVTKQIA